MQESIREFTNTARRDLRIDREQGVLHGVKIIGSQSRNGRLYPDDTLRDAIHLYENSKVNLDHPEGDPLRPRSYQDRFGLIRDVRLRENDGLYGDFRFNPRHPLAEQLLWDAENAPENVGFSHNVEAFVRRDDETVVVEKIVAVRSVDLVADPATTAGLFESEELGGISGRNHLELTSTIEAECDRTESDPFLLCETFVRAIRETAPMAEQLLDEKFLDLLRATKNEQLALCLVEDRLHLLRELSRQVIRETKPVSREQFEVEPTLDAKTFVKRILR